MDIAGRCVGVRASGVAPLDGAGGHHTGAIRRCGTFPRSRGPLPTQRRMPAHAANCDARHATQRMAITVHGHANNDRLPLASWRVVYPIPQCTKRLGELSCHGVRSRDRRASPDDR